MEKSIIKDQGQNMYTAFATSDLYQLLSLSLQLPSKELVNALLDGSYKQDSINILEELSCSKGDILQVEKSFDKLRENQKNETKLFIQMRREHTRLFYHPHQPSLGIYETVFLGNENSKDIVLFINPEALDAERCYKEAGVFLKNKSANSADHMVTELEFMMFLFRNKGKAIQEQDKENLEKAKQHIRQFEELHLAKWGHAFFKRLEIESSILPYQAIAQLAQVGLGKVLK